MTIRLKSPTPLSTNLLEIKGIPLNKVEVIQAFFLHQHIVVRFAFLDVIITEFFSLEYVK